jgi:hypothetical protein
MVHRYYLLEKSIMFMDKQNNKLKILHLKMSMVLFVLYLKLYAYIMPNNNADIQNDIGLVRTKSTINAIGD